MLHVPDRDITGPARFLIARERERIERQRVLLRRDDRFSNNEPITRISLGSRTIFKKVFRRRSIWQFRKRQRRCCARLAQHRATVEDRPTNQQVRIADWLEGSRVAERNDRVAPLDSCEPELGLKTPKTLAKVKAALAGLPLQLKSGPRPPV